MILIIFGIYALIAAKLQISRHYGLKGRGARIAGMACIAFGLGFFALFSIPIFAATRALGWPDGAAAAASFILQIIAFIIVLRILVRNYGNAYAKSPADQ
jgi:TRAP-type C4-dicarboxylate transport system permease small subunit